MECPRCQCSKIYRRKTGGMICANDDCRYHFSEKTGTAMHAGKKPREWYEKIIALRQSGLNAWKIAQAMGDPYKTYKSIYYFLKRWETASGKTKA